MVLSLPDEEEEESEEPPPMTDKNLPVSMICHPRNVPIRAHRPAETAAPVGAPVATRTRSAGTGGSQPQQTATRSASSVASNLAFHSVDIVRSTQGSTSSGDVLPQSQSQSQSQVRTRRQARQVDLPPIATIETPATPQTPAPSNQDCMHPGVLAITFEGRLMMVDREVAANWNGEAENRWKKEVQEAHQKGYQVYVSYFCSLVRC